LASLFAGRGRDDQKKREITKNVFRKSERELKESRLRLSGFVKDREENAEKGGGLSEGGGKRGSMKGKGKGLRSS